jgi:hypothetical protein
MGMSHRGIANVAMLIALACFPPQSFSSSSFSIFEHC